jgi:DNA-binding response OmpR family regulator
MVKRALIVEADRETAALLETALADEGWSVELTSLERVAERVSAGSPSVVVLDWPRRIEDGRAASIALRNRAPVGLLVLTLRHDRTTLRAIFEAGADDVLRKPFDLDELLLRVDAVARRGTTALRDDARIEVGAIVIDGTEVVVGDKPVELTQREHAMLRHLARRADRTVTRGELAALTWGGRAPSSNVLVSHVNHLRSKLGRAASQLRTVRGIGYLLSSK